MNKRAVIVNAQFLVEVPEEIITSDISEWGCEWLTDLANNCDCLDYRHPNIMGLYLRPVPVLIKETYKEDIFTDDNLIQV